MYICIFVLIAASTSALSAFVIQRRHNAKVAALGGNVFPQAAPAPGTDD